MLDRYRVQGTVAVGEVRVHLDLPQVGDAAPNVSIGYHPETVAEFEALVEALGGLDAARPIPEDESYSLDFDPPDVPEHLQNYGQRVQVNVFKPKEARPGVKGDPFFVALRERQHVEGVAA